MSFTPRLTSDGINTDNQYYMPTAYNIYNGIYNPLVTPSSIGNCTWYAFGRSMEIAERPYKQDPDASAYASNAEYWYSNAGFGNVIIRDWTRSTSGARLGAIMCWSGIIKSTGASSGGHVEVVETISGGQIRTSSSSWQTYFFRSNFYYPDDISAGYVYEDSVVRNTFQGFIYNPYATPAPTTYTVNLSVSPPNSGTVVGGGIYNAGSTVTVQAFPSTGYEFLYWSNGNTNPRFSFTIQGNTSLMAYMKRLPKGKMVMINWDGTEIFIR